MNRKRFNRITAFLVVIGVVVPLSIAAQAQGQEIPCPGRAKAIIANTGNSIHNSASLVDSYQSSLGAYGGTNVGAHGDVQAAGSIINNGGVIHGALLPNTAAGLAIVAPPSGATNLGWYNVNGTVTLAAGNYQANGININSGGKLQVSGAVRIWVSGGVNINALANPGGAPKNLEILMTGSSSVNINTGGQFFGLIYAPRGQVNVNDRVYGSVVGSSVTLNSGGQVHFDQDSACQNGSCFDGSTTVSARIDGRDRLTITPDNVSWEHFDYAGPGLLNNQDLPTTITRTIAGTTTTTSWCPVWDNGCNTCDGSCGELRQHAVSQPLPLHALAQPLTSFSFSCVGRSSCTLIQTPGPSNSYTAIIEFNDDPPGGDAVYSATINYTACPVCPAGQTLCGGTCTSTQSDANNCGSCGHACPLSSACELGSCIAAGSCLPGNAPGVAISGANVYAYEPMGSWSESTTGIKRFVLEPVSSAAVSIATPAPVNSCGTNANTLVTACTGNANDVYIINPVGGVPGTTVSATLADGASGQQFFSGGGPLTAGLAIDPVGNQAIVSVGLAPGGIGGFQPLNLASNTFGAIIPARTASGAGIQTSEDILIDPLRHLVVSPNEQNHYVLVNLNTSAVFDMDLHSTLPSPGEMDSAGEDCSTGIALSTVEFTGQLVLANLNGATFGPGTWTAPVATPNFPEFVSLSAGTSGIAVDPRSHLGVVTGEYGGPGVGIIQLPSTPLAPSAMPAVLDYVRADIPSNANCGGDWQTGLDPHSTTVYASPSSGRSFAVIPNLARSCVAVVDMQALLAAPRVSGSHTAQTPLPGGVVRFVQ